jgi:sodium-dependent dicarboxylate transporter 2/3/5
MLRWTLIILALAVFIIAPTLLLESAMHTRVTTIAGVCLVLWLSETVPPFVPTFLLWTLTPLFLGALDKKFGLANVLEWAVDPVLALFLGGFVLGVATERYGLDKRLAVIALGRAGKSFNKFLLLVILLTAFLSMWMSNIAAAALMLACLRPILLDLQTDNSLRRALLIGVALGADLGGIATPIGTGPNAIAISSMSSTGQSVSFLGWMIFALPLSVGMLLAGFLLILLRVRRTKDDWTSELGRLNQILFVDKKNEMQTPGEIGFLCVLGVTILLWLTEPFHSVPAAVVSLGVTSFLFLSGMLQKEDLLRIDWSTLLLIAGGITLGRLLEQSAIVASIATNVPFSELNPIFGLFLLCLASATLSALMSNTATVVMLIPLALALIPQPSTAILVAISASFGMPFVISTPPNAMVYGEGGVKFNDLFLPGIVLMVFGCLLISLTGRIVLNFIGIP